MSMELESGDSASGVSSGSSGEPQASAEPQAATMFGSGSSAAESEFVQEVKARVHTRRDPSVHTINNSSHSGEDYVAQPYRSTGDGLRLFSASLAGNEQSLEEDFGGGDDWGGGEGHADDSSVDLSDDAGYDKHEDSPAPFSDAQKSQFVQAVFTQEGLSAFACATCAMQLTNQTAVYCVKCEGHFCLDCDKVRHSKNQGMHARHKLSDDGQRVPHNPLCEVPFFLYSFYARCPSRQG